MSAPPSPPQSDWRATVELREDPALAHEIFARAPAPNAPRAVSVTELIAPRRAYWRAIAPVSVPAERRARMERGRELHRRLESALAPEGRLEARVRRDGIVGRIDVLGEVPVEVKTSASPAPLDALVATRPDQVEQLGVYCTLSGMSVGRLLTLAVEAPGETALQVAEIAFGEPAALRAEMLDRAESLRRAWRAGAPGALPACRWFGRGCEFQDAGVCDCTGGEPAPSDAIVSRVVSVTERVDLAENLSAGLRVGSPGSVAPRVERFRDLLYPRRTYFRRTVEEPEVPFPPRLPTEPLDLYGRLAAALESGPVGEVTRLPPGVEGPEEEVGGFRGVPFLLRTSRAAFPASASRLLDAQPQYALELGFRCAASGTSRARLILGRERAASDAERAQVFEFHFSSPETFAGLWRERAEELDRAVRDRAPGSLPPCPDWMYPDCPYRSDCQCGLSVDRSQR